MLNRHLNTQVEVKMVFHKYHNIEAIWFSKIFEAACQLWTLLFAYKRPNCTFKCPLKNVFFSWAPAWANKRGLVGAFSRHCETSRRFVDRSTMQHASTGFLVPATSAAPLRSWAVLIWSQTTFRYFGFGDWEYVRLPLIEFRVVQIPKVTTEQHLT